MASFKVVWPVVLYVNSTGSNLHESINPTFQFECNSTLSLEAYVPSLQFCSRTAPSPYEEASAETLDFVWGSYSTRVVGFESSSYTCAKACSCAGPGAVFDQQHA